MIGIVAPARQDDFHVHGGGTFQHRFKVIDDEPKENAVAVGPVFAISMGPWS